MLELLKQLHKLAMRETERGCNVAKLWSLQRTTNGAFNMVRSSAAGAALLVGALMMPQEAMALGNGSESSPAFATEFGKARPPVGFVRFCADNPADCKDRTSRARRIAMDPGPLEPALPGQHLCERQDHPGERPGTLWRSRTLDLSGRCWRLRGLPSAQEEAISQGLGFPQEALLITVVLDEQGQGHAVLTVVTDAG
jgi:predicted transglutaminase-like cysteine proteinase